MEIRKPYWLLVAITLPQVTLFMIFWRIYNRIHSILNQAALKQWFIFAAILVLLCIGLTIYGSWSLFKKREIHPYTGFVILGAYLPWLYLVFFYLVKIIPPSIPRWLFFGIEPELCLMTMIVPAFAYGILLLVFRFMPEPERYKPGIDFLLTLLIPAFWYISLRMIFPFFRFSFSVVLTHFLLVSMVITTVIFLFVFIRLIYGLLLRNPELFWRVSFPVLLVLPTACLIINNHYKLFGDFSGWGFYFLAILTGVLLALPRRKEKYYRFAVFMAKSMTLTHTAYFFLVFLPYLPLSMIAIIGFGLGFLMLVPLAFGVIHVKSLWEDFQFLEGHFRRLHLGLAFFLALLTLPGILFIIFQSDKQVIHAALNHVYHSGYSLNSGLKINQKRLERAIKNVKTNKDSGMRFLGLGEKTPYISAFYNWFVFNNLTLSQRTISTLEKIFFDANPTDQAINPQLNRSAREDLTSENVIVKDYQTKTRFDEEADCYRSWIDLELENLSGLEEEFVTNFRLPSGSFISNYYLYVDGERKKGLIADKRAATWVYEQIVNRERRDPGILYYLSGEQVVLKVFPFLPHEIRETGFEILHRGPLDISIAGKDIHIDTDHDQMIFKDEPVIPGAVWVSGQVKDLLPLVYRRPQFHFLIDFSAKSENLTDHYLSRVSRFLKEHGGIEKGVGTVNHTVSAVNYQLRTFPTKEGWQGKLKTIKAEGGFYLDRAVKAILYNNYITKSAGFPVLIVVTDKSDNYQVCDDYFDWRITFPESDRYYRLGDDGKLYELALLDQKYAGDSLLPEDFVKIPVLAWPDSTDPKAYLPNTGEPSFIFTKAFFNEKSPNIKKANWQNGLLLEALNLGLILNPGNYRQRSLSVIQSSICSGLLTPLTSYIVLENKAQEKALMEKQKQILTSDKVADIGEAISLNEPSLPVMFVVLLFLLLMKAPGQAGSFFPRVRKNL